MRSGPSNIVTVETVLPSWHDSSLTSVAVSFEAYQEPVPSEQISDSYLDAGIHFCVKYFPTLGNMITSVAGFSMDESTYLRLEVYNDEGMMIESPTGLDGIDLMEASTIRIVPTEIIEGYVDDL